MFCFKSRLKQLREQNGITQSYMSYLLDIILTAYQRYEYGTREPKLEVLYHIADYFCVSVDWLLGRDDDTRYEKYLAAAEEKFFKNPKTGDWNRKKYLEDKKYKPEAAAIYLRAQEDLRDQGIGTENKQKNFPKT